MIYTISAALSFYGMFAGILVLGDLNQGERTGIYLFVVSLLLFYFSFKKIMKGNEMIEKEREVRDE